MPSISRMVRPAGNPVAGRSKRGDSRSSTRRRAASARSRLSATSRPVVARTRAPVPSDLALRAFNRILGMPPAAR
jgi:hypothetical protein